MDNTKYGKRREGRWTPIRVKFIDTRANPNSWEAHLVRKRWDIGPLRALRLRIMMMMMMTPQQLLKLDLPLTERVPSFAFHSSVRNLGVVLDSTLTFSEYVANLTRSSYFHLRRLTLRAIRCSVSSHVFPSIVHAFVCSRIDYCNSLVVGLPKVRLSPIQSVLNAAARLIADFLVRPTYICLHV